jgi:dTDP-4-dehydrorhamnose 3,5-epimerase
VTDYYSPAAERTIVWNDTKIGIDWRVCEGCVLVSEKDQKGATLGDAEVFA